MKMILRERINRRLARSVKIRRYRTIIFRARADTLPSYTGKVTEGRTRGSETFLRVSDRCNASHRQAIICPPFSET